MRSVPKALSTIAFALALSAIMQAQVPPEIAKQLSPDSHLYPNPKNLYVRLLAECGLIGFILFVAFQLHVLGDILSLRLRAESWTRFAATAGVFAWIAITLYNLTQDSLATPNMWIAPGILAGLAAMPKAAA